MEELPLHESERRHRDLLEGLPVAVYLTDAEGTLTQFNEAAVALWGRRPSLGQEKWCGSLKLYTADGKDLPHEECPMAVALRRGEAAWGVEAQAQRPDGSRVNFLANITPLYDAAGRIAGAMNVLMDITERKRAEESLAESERKHRLVLAHVDEIVYMVKVTERDATGGTVQFVSARVKNLLGYEPAEFLADPALWFRLIHPLDVAVVVESTRSIFANRTPGTRYYRLRDKWSDGYHWIEDRVVPQLDDAGEVIGIFGVARDVTARKQAEEEKERLNRELEASRQRLETLSQRLLEVQEIERRNLARELHDEIGQALTGLRITLDACAPETTGPIAARVDDAKRQLTELVNRVRDRSLALRPAMLDHLGLLPALLWLIDHFSKRTGVRATFKHMGLARRLAPELETAAYRIVQESLTNVARHADVDEVTVRAWADADSVGVQIEDHGKGFDAESVLAAGMTTGLAGIQERVLLLEGRVTIHSRPGEGTQITAELPLIVAT